MSYTDSVMGNWSLGYDNLNRLTTTGSVSGAFQGNTGCWSYDSFGNRLGETISTSPCPTSPISILSPANNRLAGMTYSAAGNVTSDGSNSYLYDDENRLCAVRGANGGGLTGYVYDVEGRRVAKGSLTSFSCAPGNGFTLTSQYLYDSSGQQVAELDGAGNPKHNDVYAAGRVLATYDTRGLHFQLTDWLGTKRAQANASGVMEETCTNLPFGNNQICTGATDATEKHFTGKDRDSESGLDFMNARYYSSTAARFVSPDPMLMSNKHLMFPQRWNAYAYVQNNPLNAIDPDGWDDFKIFISFTAENRADPQYKGAQLDSRWASLAAKLGQMATLSNSLIPMPVICERLWVATPTLLWPDTPPSQTMLLRTESTLPLMVSSPEQVPTCFPWSAWMPRALTYSVQ